MSKTRTTLALFSVCTLTLVMTAVPRLAVAAEGTAAVNTDAVLSSRQLGASAWGLYPDRDSAIAPKTSSLFIQSRPRQVPPFPILLNRAVEKYVSEFLNQPGALEAAFKRGRPFLPRMANILERHDVPADFVYLTFAESLFTKDGQGPWQFDTATARRFGLHIDSWVDERRDPILSTKAAARYLTRLHDAADDDWRVAVVAWNLGPASLRRYWILEGYSNYRKFVSRLPRRTRGLLNRFMAVAFIAHNAAAYGIKTVNYSASLPYETREFSGGVSFETIARKCHTTVSRLRSLNPAILRDRVPPYARTYKVRVPVDSRLNVAASAF